MDKIQLCMIIKNGADTIIETLDSYKNHVFRIVILDTGSSDGTVELLKNYQNIPLVLYQKPFEGFSISRNQCLDLAYDLAYEWTIMIDDSYKLVTNFDALKNIALKVDCISIVVSKIDGMQNLSNRIIRTSSKLRYIGDIHEYIDSNITYTINSIKLVDIQTSTQMNRTYHRNINDLKILEGKTDSRSLYYRACTLNNQYIQGKIHYEEVVNAFKKRLENLEYPEERFTSMIHIGNLLYTNGKKNLRNSSHSYYLKAAITYPPRSGEAYFYLYLSTDNDHWIKKAYENRKVGLCMMSFDPTIYEVLIPKYWSSAQPNARPNAREQLL